MAPSKRKAGPVPFEDDQIHAKRSRADDLRNPRRMTPAEQGMDSVSAEGYWHCDSTQGDQQAQAKRRRVDKTYDKLCISAEKEEETFMASEDHQADGNPKPLCMIPFNVSMSNAKAGTFARAHEPVFVYLADARMRAGIRIRFFIEGTPWAEMKEKPFHDGKSITKGNLAMSIATEFEKLLTTNKRENTGELYFVDLVQECQESFRPNFRSL